MSARDTAILMNDEMLDVEERAKFNDSITRIEWHSHQPYVTSTFNSNDEIRIPVQQQDIYTLPSDSFLYIEGKLERAAGDDGRLVNNGLAFLFDEIRYELNGVEIDCTKSLGITSTIKGYASFTPTEARALENAGWYTKWSGDNTSDTFNACIPLKMVLGFAEDFRKIIINARQELILVRSKNDNNALVASSPNDTTTVRLTKIQWRMPYIYVGNPERLALLKIVERSKPIHINFRSWSAHEYPMLPETSKQTWTVKTCTGMEKPRFILLAFQTDRKNKRVANASHFDHCELTDLKLYLNSENYPYENMNLDFLRNNYALVYHFFARFQSTYYGRTGYGDPLYNVDDFLKYAPIFVIDCTRQNESLKSSTVDIRLEFESKHPFAPNTAAHCVILHDRMIEYNPLTNVVCKLL